MKGAPVLALLGAAAAMLAAALPGLARGKGRDPGPPPLDVMADAVLIDARCGTVAVDMGALLRYGESHGIAPLAILPLGPLREAFEDALSRRDRETTREALCTSVLAREQDLAPGVIKTP